MKKQAYIIDGIRTAIGNFGGTLSMVRADDLAALAIKGLICLLYTSPSPRDGLLSRMPSSA